MNMFMSSKTVSAALAGIALIGCAVDENTDPGATEETGVVAEPLGVNEYYLGAHGGSGGFFNGHVMPAAVVYAIQVNSGSKVDRVTFFYYQPTNEDNTYAGESLANASFGGNGGSNWNDAFICPLGQGVVGIYGASGSKVDRIGVVCSDVTHPDPFSSANTYSPTWGGNGGGFFDDRCGAETLMGSFNVRSGSLVDNLQLICVDAH
jgi:hypothetical protein